MGQLDDYWLEYMYEDQANKNNPQFTTLSSSRPGNVKQYLASQNVNVTSRDDIINPYEIIKSFIYTNDALGRRQYNEDLASLQAFQAQQQAYYDEWYNSPEQQNIRDRAAGLNPDIVGLSGSSAGDTSQVSADPLSNVLSDGERFAHIANGITSLVSGVASMASLPSAFSSFKLLNSQVQAQEIQNLKDFESLAGGEISSRLSDSISSALDGGEAAFDIASWFADEKNFEGIFESYSPKDNARFRSSFANVRKRMQQNLGKAYEQGKVTNENKSSFAAMAADPRYSTDFLIQVAATKPYMEAQLKAEKAIADYQAYLNEWNLKYQQGLNVETAVDVANQQNQYNAEYYEQLDAEKASRYQNLQNEVESIGLELERSIRRNYKTLYDGNENNLTGVSVAYLYRNAPKGWKDYYLASAAIMLESGVYEEEIPNTDWNGVEIPSTNTPNFMGASPSPSSIRGFIPPGSVGF